MAQMRAAPEGVYGFLTSLEDDRPKGYKDSRGVITAGVGHTGKDSAGRPLVLGKAYSAAERQRWLREDVATAIRRLYLGAGEAAILALTEHQFMAMISFAFNLGFDPKWQIAKDLRTGRLAAVPAQIVRFDHAVDETTGKLVVVPGLENRRLAEKIMWETADEVAAVATAQAAPVAPPPSSTTREIDTPPAPVAPPTRKPLITGLAGAAAMAAPVIQTVKQGVDSTTSIIQPYSEHSALLQQALAGLAIVGAGLACTAAALMWLHARQAAR